MSNTIGEIKMICHNIIPDGWMLCDGAKLSIAGNERLFAKIGKVFGGDGIEDFKLPNYKDRFLKGSNDGDFSFGGSSTIVLKPENLPSHSHNLGGNASVKLKTTVPFNPTNESAEGETYLSSGGNQLDIYTEELVTNNDFLGGFVFSGKTDNSGVNTPINHLPRFANINFIINVDDI